MTNQPLDLSEIRARYAADPLAPEYVKADLRNLFDELGRLDQQLKEATDHEAQYQREIERLRATVKKLREGVDNYGFHLDDCPAHNALACTCGWSDFDESSVMHDDRLPDEPSAPRYQCFEPGCLANHPSKHDICETRNVLCGPFDKELNDSVYAVAKIMQAECAADPTFTSRGLANHAALAERILRAVVPKWSAEKSTES